MITRIVALGTLVLSACGSSTNPGSAAGTGGAASATCSNGSVTFQVVPAAKESALWCMGAPGGCSSTWLSIRDSAGDMAIANNCGTPCDTCQTLGCPNLCQVPSELDTAGLTQTWDGTYFTAGTCGASATSCLDQHCATAGSYTAEICGFANPAPDAGLGCTGAASTTPLTCVEKPFDFPASAPIVVTMPAP